MENFCEYLVKQKAGVKIVALRALLIIGFFVLSAISYIGIVMTEVLKGFIMIYPLLCFLYLVAVWFLWELTSIEYEYTIISGYFQLDKIIAKKRRKSICQVKTSEMKFICPVNEKNVRMLDESKYKRIIKACSSMTSEDLYALAYKDEKDGDTLIYFDAVEKTLNVFVYYNKNAVIR